MHLGIGEEGIVAGLLAHLGERGSRAGRSGRVRRRAAGAGEQGCGVTPTGRPTIALRGGDGAPSATDGYRSSNP